jgi:hypothetical protein
MCSLSWFCRISPDRSRFMDVKHPWRCFSSIWRPYPLLIILFTHAGVLLAKLPVLLGVLQSAKYIPRLSTGYTPTNRIGQGSWMWNIHEDAFFIHLGAISITDHNIYPRWCVTREITSVVGVLQSAKHTLRLSTGYIPTYPAGVKNQKACFGIEPSFWIIFWNFQKPAFIPVTP